MSVHPLRSQWEIDKLCVTCGKYEPRYHECPDCIRKRNREQVQRWAKNNPDGIKVHAHATRARKLGLTEHFSVEEWHDLCQKYGNVCLRCHQQKRLVPDHVIPLGQEGSTNTIENIQPLCRPCNSVKNSKRTDYRIGAPIFGFPLTYKLPQLMRLPGSTMDRFLRVE